MTKQAQKYDCLTGRIRAIVFCSVRFTPPVSAADARKPLIHRGLERNLQENLLKDINKGDKRSVGLLLPFSSLMVWEESKNPLHHSSYFTHVRSMPSAGERQAFSLEEDRSQKTEDRILARRNSGNPRHFERSGAESRNPFTPKHCEERKISHRLHRFSQKFQSADKLCSQASGFHGAGRKESENNRDTICGMARFSEHKCGRKICENQRNLREIIS